MKSCHKTAVKRKKKVILERRKLRGLLTDKKLYYSNEARLAPKDRRVSDRF